MSFGESDGGATAATAPVALRLRDGGGGNGPPSGGEPASEPGTPDSVDRSSGAPARRPPGAPTGGSAVTIGGGSFWHAAERTRHARVHWDSATDRTRRSGVLSRAVAAARWQGAGPGPGAGPSVEVATAPVAPRPAHARERHRQHREADFRAAGCDTATARWSRSSGEFALQGARSAAPARWSDRPIRPGRRSAAASARTCGQSPTAANSLLGGGGVRNAKGGNQGRCRKPTEDQKGHREVFGLPAAV